MLGGTAWMVPHQEARRPVISHHQPLALAPCPGEPLPEEAASPGRRAALDAAGQRCRGTAAGHGSGRRVTIGSMGGIEGLDLRQIVSMGRIHSDILSGLEDLVHGHYIDASCDEKLRGQRYASAQQQTKHILQDGSR